MTAIAVVVVSHESAELLRTSLPAVRDQLAPEDEIVVVDNRSADGSAKVARSWARVIASERNRGFAGGAALGARETTAPLLLFLNPDVVVRPGCLDALRKAAANHPGWGAWQAVVALPGGTRVNTAGNVVHYLGIGWAGRLGEPVEAVDADQECGFASGAALVVRRSAWDAVGGFDERYFMYGEDLDLGLRLRLAGWRSGVVAHARVEHDYEFAKGAYKWFYLERNRLWTVLAVYPLPLLLGLAPALIAFEAVLLFAAARGGWLRAKIRAQLRVVRDLPAIVRRRRTVQATRTVGAGEFASALATSLESPNLPALVRRPLVQALQRTYFNAISLPL
jgi:N-acetylglucosaminyl-diphospho-decaprenol L-rhamnosyltransferase